MINLFTTASKYISILLILLYTFCNFRALAEPDQEEVDAFTRWQSRIILLIHFLFSCIIMINTNDLKAVYFYVIQLLFLILYPLCARLIYRNINQLLMNNVCLFLTYGLIMLERLEFDKAVKQFVIIAMSAALTIAIPFLIDKIWNLVRWRYIFMGVGILLLLMVMIIGATSYGAKMSISIGGMSFQASEIVKITFVIGLAGMLTTATNFRDMVVASIVAAIHVLILVGCKDLGSALIFFVAYLLMIYIASHRIMYLVLGTGAAAAAGMISYRLFSHVRTRVFAWKDPFADIDNKGYQITQSLFAIGTGGFTGLGLYQGMPYKIPIVDKDFIFSAISEEMGAVTAICLIFICMGCFIQMMMSATCMKSAFYKLISVGLAAEYALQCILTIGGAIKFIPSTGVTLPFVSYGGSSLISSFAVFMIIQALYIIEGNENEDDEDDEEEDEEVEDDVEGEEYADDDNEEDDADAYDDEDYDDSEYTDDEYDDEYADHDSEDLDDGQADGNHLVNKSRAAAADSDLHNIKIMKGGDLYAKH